MHGKHGTGKPSDPSLKKQRSLRFSVWDGSLYSAMVGFGETYFVPLLVFLGATNSQVGIFSALPQLGIAFSQFISILLIDYFMHRKRVLIGGSLFQAIMLLAMLVFLFGGGLKPWIFIALAIVYFMSNGIAIPAWNSLIGDLTTPETRGAYFGRRNGITQLVSFAAMLSAGYTIQYFVDSGNGRIGFAVIIAAAFFSRAGSVFFQSKHYEVPYERVSEARFSFWDFIRRSPNSNFAHFVFFVGFMSFAVHTASPFFVVYMLRDLELSYFQYTLAQGTFIITQFIAMRRWGPFSDKYGNRMVLRISATIMPFVPLMWLFSKTYPAIILFQFISGLAWAGWALSSANFIFDAVTPPKRARCAAYLNFFNSFGVFAGAMTGAYLCSIIPPGLNTGVVEIIFISNLNYLFLISAALRFLVVFLFMPTVREVRAVEKESAADMFMMLTNIRPFSGVRFTPFTGFNTSHNNDRKE